VSFEAGDDPERSGFEILSRETTEARYKVLQKVDAAGSHVLSGVRIDDAEFAVRAVGKNGERSIAVTAKAQVRRPAGAPPAK
jgi:hypothetical protein